MVAGKKQFWLTSRPEQVHCGCEHHFDTANKPTRNFFPDNTCKNDKDLLFLIIEQIIHDFSNPQSTIESGLENKSTS